MGDEIRIGELNFGNAFSGGWDLFKRNMGICVLACLLIVLVSCVSCFICWGPLLAGLFMMLHRMAKNSEPKPKVADVFMGFSKFLPGFLLIFLPIAFYAVVDLVLEVIPVVGFLISMVLTVLEWVVEPMLVWSLILVVNRGMSCGDAVGLVFKEAFGGKLMTAVLLGVVADVIGFAGLLLCGVGVFFTLPLSYCIYAAAYEQLFGGEEGSQAAA